MSCVDGPKSALQLTSWSTAGFSLGFINNDDEREKNEPVTVESDYKLALN